LIISYELYHSNIDAIYDMEYEIGCMMRLIKECLHCGREFSDMSSDFCSLKCADEVSGK